MNYHFPHEDTRIVFGFRCVWWGGIEDVGRLCKDMSSTIPGCPHCGGPLMEVDSPNPSQIDHSEVYASIDDAINAHGGRHER